MDSIIQRLRQSTHPTTTPPPKPPTSFGFSLASLSATGAEELRTWLRTLWESVALATAGRVAARALLKSEGYAELLVLAPHALTQQGQQRYQLCPMSMTLGRAELRACFGRLTALKVYIANPADFAVYSNMDEEV